MKTLLVVLLFAVPCLAATQVTVQSSYIDWEKLPDIKVDKDITDAIHGGSWLPNAVELQILRELLKKDHLCVWPNPNNPTEVVK